MFVCVSVYVHVCVVCMWALFVCTFEVCSFVCKCICTCAQCVCMCVCVCVCKFVLCLYVYHGIHVHVYEVCM